MEGGSENGDDYEALPPNLPASVHMVAGASAGILEHCIMYPVDCIKTRMQALNVKNPHYSGISNAFSTIITQEGARKLWRGMPAVAAGAGPAHAMYFACYEKVKWVLSEKKQSTVGATMVAGGCATLLHDGIMVPADVIKQRMQMYNSPYRSMVHCVSTVVRTEGIRALYRSYTTQLTMNVPFQMVHFLIYEQCQNLLNFDREYKPATHILSGGIAGGVAAWLTNPLDVCKTLLNTQEVCCNSGKPADQGLIQACKTVYQCRQFRGFFNGAWARTLFVMPSTGISWFLYETFKVYYGGWQSSSSDEDSFTVDHNNRNRKATSLIEPVYANDTPPRSG